jgi:alpha-1,2-mannosyltransferase
VLTVLLSLRPIAGDLSHGNVNLFILFLVVAFLYAFHRGRDLLAGLLLALAMACKVTPALFVPYLVWKRAWRALAGCAAGLALFFWPGLVPASFLGWDENLQRVHSWVDCMVKPYLVDGVVTSEHHNQSLPGLVQRLLTDSPSFVAYPDNQWTPVQWHNVASLPSAAARWLVKGFMGLFELLVVWACRTPREGPDRSDPRLAAEYGIVLLGMLLFSERTWKHHCVTLLLPFAVLSYQLAVSWPRRVLRGYLVASLAAVVLLMSTTSTSLLGREAGKLAQVYGAYVVAFVVLLAALAVLLRRADEPDRAERARPLPLAA